MMRDRKKSFTIARTQAQPTPNKKNPNITLAQTTSPIP